MPFLIPLLLLGTGFGIGAFAGAQVDDAIDQPPLGVPITQNVSATKILLYGAAGLALVYGAQKTGLIKKF